MTRTGDHLFWITGRAAGITTLLLASAAVAAGLLIGSRAVRGPRAPDVRALHEILSLATLASLAVHALSLLGDAYLHPSVPDLLVPFVSDFQRWWTATGIVAGWSMVALGLSFYARKRIGAGAGARRIASPRWPGSWAWPTRSARGRTPARPGSWRSWRSRSCPRSYSCSPGCVPGLPICSAHQPPPPT